MVSENAVTFSTERRFANWVVGYCLNNAKHRLNQAMGSEELLETIDGRPGLDVWDEYYSKGFDALLQPLIKKYKIK